MYLYSVFSGVVELLMIFPQICLTPWLSLLQLKRQGCPPCYPLPLTQFRVTRFGLTESKNKEWINHVSILFYVYVRNEVQVICPARHVVMTRLLILAWYLIHLPLTVRRSLRNNNLVLPSIWGSFYGIRSQNKAYEACKTNSNMCISRLSWVHCLLPGYFTDLECRYPWCTSPPPTF